MYTAGKQRWKMQIRPLWSLMWRGGPRSLAFGGWVLAVSRDRSRPLSTLIHTGVVVLYHRDGDNETFEVKIAVVISSGPNGEFGSQWLLSWHCDFFSPGWNSSSYVIIIFLNHPFFYKNNAEVAARMSAQADWRLSILWQFRTSSKRLVLAADDRSLYLLCVWASWVRWVPVSLHLSYGKEANRANFMPQTALLWTAMSVFVLFMVYRRLFVLSQRDWPTALQVQSKYVSVNIPFSGDNKYVH